jgi:predicted dinucleotide-binding enzyme
MQRIGILGAGQLGEVLARRLVSIGLVVKVANSRGHASLRDFARRTGAEAADISTVAANVDILIIAIPLGEVRKLPRALFDVMSDKTVIVDAGNYVPSRDEAIAEIEDGLPETLWVSRQLGVPIVKAFNSISDVSLGDKAKPAGARDRIALPVAGDVPAHRKIVMKLVEELGFDAYDAGTLAESWRQQIGQPAYCTDLTSEQLSHFLKQAELTTVARNRENAMRLMARLPADPPKADLVRAARFMVGLGRWQPASWRAVMRVGLATMRRKQRD